LSELIKRIAILRGIIPDDAVPASHAPPSAPPTPAPTP
jgi:hypothetical protein